LIFIDLDNGFAIGFSSNKDLKEELDSLKEMVVNDEDKA